MKFIQKEFVFFGASLLLISTALAKDAHGDRRNSLSSDLQQNKVGQTLQRWANEPASTPSGSLPMFAQAADLSSTCKENARQCMNATSGQALTCAKNAWQTGRYYSMVCEDVLNNSGYVSCAAVTSSCAVATATQFFTREYTGAFGNHQPPSPNGFKALECSPGEYITGMTVSYGDENDGGVTQLESIKVHCTREFGSQTHKKLLGGQEGVTRNTFHCSPGMLLYQLTVYYDDNDVYGIRPVCLQVGVDADGGRGSVIGPLFGQSVGKKTATAFCSLGKVSPVQYRFISEIRLYLGSRANDPTRPNSIKAIDVVCS